MNMKNINPELRFDGFTEDWEERDFEQVFTNISNNSLSRDKLNYVSGMAKNVHYGDILVKFNEVLDAQNKILPYVSDNAIVEKLKGSYLKDGDIIIADAAEDEIVGKCIEIINVKDEIVLSGLHTIAVRPKQKFAHGFLGYYMNSNSYHDQLMKLMQGTKVLSISKSAIKNTVIKNPKSEDEQQKIGNFFENLDTLITEHQHKHSKLKALKKAMLSKMFPQEGQRVPEIRFKGFSDKWIQSDLKNIFNFQYGIFNNNPSNGGEFPVYGANGVIGGYSEYNASDSVVIGHMGEYAGIVLWAEGKHFVTYNGIITKPKNEELLPKFGYFLLYNMDLRKICDGSGQPFLSYTILNSRKGIYPKSHDEQNKIGNYFKNLDDLITNHQIQIEKLNNLKKAFLAKMFI
jgi:type I restriction enzyme, S subunit